MKKYSRIFPIERRAVPTPKDMVKDGKCVFGTFDKEFETWTFWHKTRRRRLTL